MTKRKPNLGTRLTAKSAKTQSNSKDAIKTIWPKILTIRTEMPNKAKGVKQKEVKMTKMTLV